MLYLIQINEKFSLVFQSTDQEKVCPYAGLVLSLAISTLCYAVHENTVLKIVVG